MISFQICGMKSQNKRAAQKPPAFTKIGSVLQSEDGSFQPSITKRAKQRAHGFILICFSSGNT